MTYKVTLTPRARQAIADLTPAQRNGVHAAINGPLARTPLRAGQLKEGRSEDGLRVLPLPQIKVSVGHRVYPAYVEVQIVWMNKWP